MFGTRNLFYKSDKINTGENSCSPHIGFLRRLYQQSKQISQIIAYIWRWAGEDEEHYPVQTAVANKLKTYFEQPDSPEGLNAQHLRELFKANPTLGDPQFPDPAYLLKQVFPEGIEHEGYIFPIFNDFERGEIEKSLGYSFEITFSSFVGQILDADNNNPELFKMIIPYPPCPGTGEATFTKQTLEDWITNRNKDQYFSTNPYIPTTCS